jgi:hypothetical protein
MFSTKSDEQFLKKNAYFSQTQTDDILNLPKEVPNIINHLHAGPTVNHLFMHIIVHSDLSSICLGRGILQANIPQESKKIKKLAKEYIKIAKGKNTTLKLIEESNDDATNAKLLRKYTTSKRSGDYENTNAAKYYNAVLFCGDEPEFVYAMLNEQPAIYHTSGRGQHKFRIYIPKNSSSMTEEEHTKLVNEQIINNYIHKAFEYTRLFTDVNAFIRSYLTNINTVLTNPLIINESKNNEEIERIFKYIIQTVILNNKSIITLLKQSEEKYAALGTNIKTKLSTYKLETLPINSK